MLPGKALLCGSFDPFTSADLAMFKAFSLGINQHVVINVEPTENPTFSEEERVNLIKEVIRAEVSEGDLPRIEVIASPLAPRELVKQLGADTLQRFFVPSSDTPARIYAHETERDHLNEYKVDFRIVRTRNTDVLSEDMIKELYRRRCFTMAERFVPTCVHHAMLKVSLRPLWNDLFKDGKGELYWQKLMSAYSARPYHNLSHIGRMFDMLRVYENEAKDGAPLTKELTLAIFVHDYVQQGADVSAEQASADFIDEMALALVPEISVTQAKLLVVTTDHKNLSPVDQYALIQDLDLSILAAEPPVFRRYCDDIRREYGNDNAAYVAERINFLEDMLKRQNIFHTIYFHERYEDKAIHNLKEEIARLHAMRG